MAAVESPLAGLRAVTVLGVRGGVAKTAVADAIAMRIATTSPVRVCKVEAIRREVAFDDRGRAFPPDLEYLLDHDPGAARADVVPLLVQPTDRPADVPANHCLDRTVNVYVGGTFDGAMSLAAYCERRTEYLDSVFRSLIHLWPADAVRVVVGSGAAVELHLRDGSVSLRTAAAVTGPVVLVADVHAGGALAALTGTLDLMPAAIRGRVRGLVLTRAGNHRDGALVAGVRAAIEDVTGVPVLGVMQCPQQLWPPDQPPPAGERFDATQVAALCVDVLVRESADAEV